MIVRGPKRTGGKRARRESWAQTQRRINSLMANTKTGLKFLEIYRVHELPRTAFEELLAFYGKHLRTPQKVFRQKIVPQMAAIVKKWRGM